MLQIGGWLSWQAIKAFMPKAPPWLGYALAVLATIGLLVFFGYHIGSQGKDAAVAERDLEWIKKIGKQNNEFERASERARLAADRVMPTPVDRVARVRSCAESPTCRERDQ